MGLKTLLFPWTKPKKKISWIPEAQTEAILELMGEVEQHAAMSGIGLAGAHYRLWLEINKCCPPTVPGARRSVGYSGNRGAVFIEEEIP